VRTILLLLLLMLLLSAHVLLLLLRVLTSLRPAAAIGSFLFVASDSCLAVHRSSPPSNASVALLTRGLVMPLYLAALYLLTLSCCCVPVKARAGAERESADIQEAVLFAQKHAKRNTKTE